MISAFFKDFFRYYLPIVRLFPFCVFLIPIILINLSMILSILWNIC
ncbi:hypothetical protein D922_00072 [Enterococcus faecalis 06-MB-DW-09]|nr:hypothetical protein D922_00072 [Enterococcus faecalis 06-MB-DW-09]